MANWTGACRDERPGSFKLASVLQVLFLVSLLGTLASPAEALRIIVAPTSSVNEVTNVYWVREASDDFDMFDIRFVIDRGDVGLAKANIAVDGGRGKVGREVVRFPNPGKYQLVAVTGYVSFGRAWGSKLMEVMLKQTRESECRGFE